jgi:hypothetical protein
MSDTDFRGGYQISSSYTPLDSAEDLKCQALATDSNVISTSYTCHEQCFPGKVPG